MKRTRTDSLHVVLIGLWPVADRGPTDVEPTKAPGFRARNTKTGR